MTKRLAFKEFRGDGWPLCPNCEEDELYSYLMLRWTKSEPPTVSQCMLNGMRCYRCDWESSGMNLFGNKCFHCNERFETPEPEPDYVNCSKCRTIIKSEATAERIRTEVRLMEWPEVIG